MSCVDGKITRRSTPQCGTSKKDIAKHPMTTPIEFKGLSCCTRSRIDHYYFFLYHYIVPPIFPFEFIHCFDKAPPGSWPGVRISMLVYSVHCRPAVSAPLIQLSVVIDWKSILQFASCLLLNALKQHLVEYETYSVIKSGPLSRHPVWIYI